MSKKLPVGKTTSIMNERDYLHQSKTASLLLEREVEMQALGVHQLEDVVLNRTADDQQLLEVKEEPVPHLWRSSLDQQDPDLIIIKHEEEELWRGQEGEQLPVKNEDDVKPQLLQLHQIKTEDNSETKSPTSSSAEHMKAETDGEDSGGPEPDRNHDPNTNLQPNTDEKASDSSETENSDDYDEDENLSGSGTREIRTPGSDVKDNVGHKSANKSISCPECCKQFVNQRSLQKHMTSHSGESSSGLVDKCFRKDENVDLQEVKADKKTLSCDVCGKTFDYRCRFKRHMSVHTGDKPFACDDCGKTFFYESRLKRHMSVHTGDKLFACDKCGETFRYQYYLKHHMRRHPGAKPFACDDCGKTFQFPHELKYHMVQHTGVKHFHCDKCRKALGYLPVVNPNLKLQPAEKPFQCEVCDKKISTKGNLKQHMLLHTGDKTLA